MGRSSSADVTQRVVRPAANVNSPARAGSPRPACILLRRGWLHRVRRRAATARRGASGAGPGYRLLPRRLALFHPRLHTSIHRDTEQGPAAHRARGPRRHRCHRAPRGAVE
jgi:hypothetical protein